MKLALGTVQFGLNYGIANRAGQVSLDAARAILDLARSSGVDMLDTATSYGESEQRLGELGIGGWQVVSKLPAAPEGCTDFHGWALAAATASLQRCRIDGFYGLLLHRPQQLLEDQGDRLFAALQRLKHEGLVRKIGVSIYDPQELQALCARYPLDLVQAPFNILDRRLIDSGWFERLGALGIELHVRSIFLQGLLLMDAQRRPAKFARWSALWQQYDSWLEHHGLTPLQACVSDALSFPAIARVVVGVDSTAQLEEIVHAGSRTLPPLPAQLRTGDVDLLNPARWAAQS